MVARRRIADITGQIVGRLPAAFSAMLTAAGRAEAGRLPRPAAVSLWPFCSPPSWRTRPARLRRLRRLFRHLRGPRQLRLPWPYRPRRPRHRFRCWHGAPCSGGFQCANARVPLNYRDPDGATISISVASGT